MEETRQFVACEVGEHLLAFPLDEVERVLPALAPRPPEGRAPEGRPPQGRAAEEGEPGLADPGLPDLGLLGVIDLAGEVLPLIDARAPLGLPARPLALRDAFLLIREPAGGLALRVERVLGVLQGQRAEPPPLAQGAPFLRGSARLELGLALLCGGEGWVSAAARAALEAQG